ncbi:MAG: hypothetical protein JWN57_783 [Frankiales bacterium]|nr:hypothetical protein [Frankiales bacterium]
MRWILIDIAIALVALAVMAVLVLGLWRRVTSLGREVSRAGELVGRATEDLARVQDAAPHGGARPNELHTAYAPAPVRTGRTTRRSRSAAR